jgi:hypothetical protein
MGFLDLHLPSSSRTISYPSTVGSFTFYFRRNDGSNPWITILANVGSKGLPDLSAAKRWFKNGQTMLQVTAAADADDDDDGAAASDRRRPQGLRAGAGSSPSLVNAGRA